MKKYVVAILVILTLFAFRNNRAENRSAEIRTAVNKSLDILQTASHVFLKNSVQLISCHSCHNQGLGVVAFAMARENGYALRDSIIKEAIDSTETYWKRYANWQTLAENDDPVAIVMSSNYDLWGLSSIGYKGSKIIDLVTRNIMRKQNYDGSWISPAQRPPLEYYTFSATALTVRNIQKYLPAILKDEVAQRIDKARTWMTQKIPVTNEERIFQLLGLTWSTADKKIIAQQAKKLLATQHADGGWSQLATLETDAYATGQSLYALYESGQLPASDPAFQKGIDFLLQTQQPDGSWHVKTRSYSYIPFVDSGFPHEKDQFISATGSNWATMALMLSVRNDRK